MRRDESRLYNIVSAVINPFPVPERGYVFGVSCQVGWTKLAVIGGNTVRLRFFDENSRLLKMR
ncbi:hypothetical protein GNF10_28525 [Nostoc sp. UCD121]|uniref:hypothetical protein n=1 Tax=unclassified Nostoc TaxID=2593658 RepID=UPI00162890F2|nr:MULTISPECIES: hypothetical protein [unclassified Nostoc]MBC1221802.1 hypothetical protein [Nostoc sp. UCD120]MBC1279794.1 hypothetical protein [Nostoc sp. UCD121]MBC1298559.1 hypothetical protein [Nostoc sp. UCD122]